MHKLAEKATKALYEVFKRGRLHNLSIQCHLHLFDKIVQPILLYGCEVWGFSNFAAIERLSNIWLEQTTHSTKWLKAKIKLTLTAQFKQNWQSTGGVKITKACRRVSNGSGKFVRNY